MVAGGWWVGRIFSGGRSGVFSQAEEVVGGGWWGVFSQAEEKCRNSRLDPSGPKL